MKRKAMKTIVKNRLRYFNLFSRFWFFVFGLLLPTQFGKHFWPKFAFLDGVRIDYFSPTIYLIDLILVAYLFWKFFTILTSSKFLNKLVLKPEMLKPASERGELRVQHDMFRVSSRTCFGIPLRKFRYMGFILLFLFLNFILAQEKLLWLYRLYQYAKIFFVYLIFKNSSSWQRKNFLLGLGISSVFCLALSIFQIKNQGSLQGVFYFFGERLFNINSPNIATVAFFGQKVLRPYATFSHPNSLAGFFLFGLFLFNKEKLWFFSLICLLLIILSFSKITIVIFVFLNLWLMYQTDKNCRLCRISKLGLFLWLLWFSFLWRGSSDSLSLRLAGYITSLNFIIRHPFGNGLGNYLILFKTGVSYAFRYQPVHNTYLLLLIELGWVVIWAGIFLIKQLRNLSLWQKAVIGSLLLTALFDHYHLTLIQNQLMLGVVLGFLTVKENPRTGGLI